MLFVILYYYTIFVFCGRYYYMERKNQILFKYYFPWIMEDVGAINCDWFWFLDKLVRNFIKIWKILDLINTNPRSNPSFGFSRFIQFKPTQEWKWLNIFSWLICHSSPFLLQIQLNVQFKIIHLASKNWLEVWYSYMQIMDSWNFWK